MSRKHRAPVLAFVIMAVVCTVVLTYSIRGNASEHVETAAPAVGVATLPGAGSLITRTPEPATLPGDALDFGGSGDAVQEAGGAVTVQVVPRFARTRQAMTRREVGRVSPHAARGHVANRGRTAHRPCRAWGIAVGARPGRGFWAWRSVGKRGNARGHRGSTRAHQRSHGRNHGRGRR